MKKSASFLIISSFLVTILAGALLLMLPASTVRGTISFENALFTSASAVTVTGLIVVDTATYFTSFGQTVILVLLQLGGLGFMTFSTFTILLMGKSFSLKDKSIIENDFTTGSYKNLKDLLKKIVILTFAIELAGSAVLYFQFTGLKGGARVFASVFHGISAFCNAGFSIFSNSLEDYISHAGINITIMLLIILGGIGFLVIYEVLLLTGRRGKRSGKGAARFTLHSRVVIITSALLILLGFVVILVEELLNPANTLSFWDNAMASMFQSVSARTAGFNSINLNSYSHASIFIMIILMFIGASPGSTGGGVKTTSAGMVMAYFRSQMRGREKVSMFYRNIPAKTLEKAFIVIIISFLMIAFFILLLLSFEPRLKTMDIVFEVFSAFGTVGLSKGITAQFTLPSKLTLILTMFIGRIGPLTLLIAMSKQQSKAVYNYPEENIMVG